ncbi:hypothetical protein [Arthrobacter sp. 260]|uniref:hypothetical protein n=1 Tax=Arthrobacter sp. 260 TaxID=2735314 RepID=UPI001492A5FF|nr:hypothetical protein [Arthrobacter sp. 260]NOJ58424.1 hypothetical protein [Arthrobacter sp. 260]
MLAITVERLDGNVLVALICMGVPYALLNDGRAMWRLRRRGSGRGPVLWFYYVFNLVLITGLVALSLTTYRVYMEFVPEPDELIFALWTAVFAAVLATAFQQLLRTPNLSVEQKLAAARKDMGEGTWAYVEEAASNANCEPVLMRAIVAAEALQRPRWMRRLERAKGRVIPEGSYGVAQMTASKPLSDAQSVQALCDQHAGYYPVRNSAGYVRDALLRARIEKHNSNPEFVASVMEFYHHLTPWVQHHSASISYDGRPHIEVVGVQRIGSQFEIKGFAVIPSSQLCAAYCDDAGWHSPVEIQDPGDRRQGWGTRVPLEATQVVVYECSNGNLDDQNSVTLSLEY